MFGGWPHELLAVPLSEYRKLSDYYFEVKRKEAEAMNQSEDSDFSDG